MSIRGLLGHIGKKPAPAPPPPPPGPRADRATVVALEAALALLVENDIHGGLPNGYCAVCQGQCFRTWLPGAFSPEGGPKP